MDYLTILLIIAAILLFYQVVIYKDPDQLDRRGHPIKNKKRGKAY